MTLEEISPSTEIPFVIIQCHQNISQNYTITDLDGTDSPITNTDYICTKDEYIRVVWTQSTYQSPDTIKTFVVTDTAFTKTKDQIVITDNESNVIDGIVYWDGESTFDSTSPTVIYNSH